MTANARATVGLRYCVSALSLLHHSRPKKRVVEGDDPLDENMDADDGADHAENNLGAEHEDIARVVAHVIDAHRFVDDRDAHREGDEQEPPRGAGQREGVEEWAVCECEEHHSLPCTTPVRLRRGGACQRASIMQIALSMPAMVA